ncbi:sigma-70 family RNA polymerase sigma factor [Streptomyces sp. NPDC020489]|uniref:sigma-70 family RNA polymerase sigma factor n=1 Tax=Streptomyces sp. NPDC020489 TaxID=3365077 RepID=UPI0037A8322D
MRTRDVPQSSADPEDVVQNALKSVLAVTDPIGNVRAYVYTCMGNEIKRAAGRQAEGRGYASLDADVRLENEPAAPPGQDVELRHFIDEALADLPLQQRRAMLLTRELGMTQAEAAQVMGTRPATVGVHAHRAIRALRVALVGMGTALISWATGSMAFSRQQIIPGAGPEIDSTVYSVAMSMLITVGLICVGLGGTLSGYRLRFLRLGDALKAWGLRRTPDDEEVPIFRDVKEPPSDTHTRTVPRAEAPARQEVVIRQAFEPLTRAERIRRTGAAAARVRAQAGNPPDGDDFTGRG